MVASSEIRRILSELIQQELSGFRDDGSLPRDLGVQFVVSTFLTVLGWLLTRNTKPAPAHADEMFRRLVISGNGAGGAAPPNELCRGCSAMDDAMGKIGTWLRWDRPEDAGWSSALLAEAKAYAERGASEAVMIVAGGRVLAAWGAVATRYNVHSIRKTLLSALIGIHEAEGRIDPEATLEGLGVDDRQGLTAREKLATVLDLLTARSGVYHPSGYETAGMIAAKPTRGSAGPGTVWCYNNWDFNALGTIFRKTTGADIHADFAVRIAAPVGMEDFRPETDGTYVTLRESDHPAYPFRMTTRDLARFGEMYLRHGRASGQAVVPAHWVRMSVLPYSDAGTAGAYGYMWWVERSGILFPNTIVPSGTYAARGAGGHVVVVVPALDSVIVHRVDTDQPGREVANGRLGKLLGMLLRST